MDKYCHSVEMNPENKGWEEEGRETKARELRKNISWSRS
jgi:hypothetical protein